MSKRNFITLTNKYTSKKKAINIDDITSYEEKDDYVCVSYIDNDTQKIINIKETFGFITYIINKSKLDNKPSVTFTEKKIDNTIYNDKLRFTDIDNNYHCYNFSDIKTHVATRGDIGIIYFSLTKTRFFSKQECYEIYAATGLSLWEYINSIESLKNDYLRFNLNLYEIKSVQRQYAKYRLNNPIVNSDTEELIIKEENESIYQQDSSI